MSGFFVAQARRLLAAKDYEGALAACARAAQAEPGDAEPWFMRGTIELFLGRAPAAVASAREAVARTPGDAKAHVLLGNALNDTGHAQDARDAYAQATAIAPGWGVAWLRLGTVAFDLGETREAEAAFERAVELDAGQASAWNNLAIARLERGALAEAEAALARALQVQPDYARAFYNLARVARARNDGAYALELSTIAERLDPALADARMLSAELLRAKGDARGARERLEALVASHPRHVQARNQLAEHLSDAGHAAEAREHYRAALALRPASLRSALGARLTLPAVYDSLQDLERWRAEYAHGLAELEAGAGAFAAETPERLARDAQWCNFLLAYQGRDDIELQRRYGAFIASVLRAAFPRRFEPPAPRPARARPRIGFFSHFFFDCTAGRYFESWVTDLDPGRFESFVYYTNPWTSEATRRVASATPHFRHCVGMPLPELARVVEDDELDVLVFPELGMHAPTYALAAMRLAPVQACGWGHPVTSGHANVDHFLSVAAMEPEGAKASYVERLHGLPGLGTRYPMPRAPSAARRALGLPEGKRLYLLPQSLFKIHPDNDAVVASVLEADAGGSVVLFEGRQPAVTEAFLGRLARACGLSPARLRERLVLLPYMAHERFLEVNAACDVMVDTLHWSGGNTTLDALACGLPVVTSRGALMRGRQSAAMLSAMGLEELVREPADLAATAVAVARDGAARARLSQAIGERRGELFDRREPVLALHDFLASVTP